MDHYTDAACGCVCVCVSTGGGGQTGCHHASRLPDVQTICSDWNKIEEGNTET